ncbi:hypothetical protein [Streptomyces sp. NPDC017448]|uniref:hypothetical protein n=1 Tax=Streptomyces sp. NPDC017448 TaxID=3364996 RepID=UPI003788B08D
MREHCCAVCGTLLFLTAVTSRMATVYCADKPCHLYPPLHVKDSTLGPWAVALHEGLGISASAVGRALGKSQAYGGHLVKQQTERWQKSR